MILALDIGNTNIVIGCLDGEKIYFEGRLATDRNKTEMEYAVMFKNILDIYHVRWENLEGAIVSSVVPPLTQIIKQAVHAVIGVMPLEVSACSNHGLKFAIDHPEEVGNDLTVAAVAALSEYKPPLVIIDMGTATTISVINRDGVYCGGAILPGLKISQEALTGRTSQLPSISLDAPKNVIGTNTTDCMKSGMIYGTAAMLDGMIHRIEASLGNPVTVLATGGLSAAVIPFCERNIYYDNDLLIKGLWQIYCSMQKK